LQHYACLIWRVMVFSCLQLCASVELFFNGKCESCPSSGICDGSAALTCIPGFYLTDLNVTSSASNPKPVCRVCPEVSFHHSCMIMPVHQYCIRWPKSLHDDPSLDLLVICTNDELCLLQGGDCSTGCFTPKNSESFWEKVSYSDGSFFRITSCPPGFALTVSTVIESVVSVSVLLQIYSRCFKLCTVTLFIDVQIKVGYQELTHVCLCLILQLKTARRWQPKRGLMWRVSCGLLQHRWVYK